MPHAQWLSSYCSDLIGFTVTKVEVNSEDGEHWPILHFTNKQTSETRTVEVARDPEGNGPGFLFGLVTPNN